MIDKIKLIDFQDLVECRDLVHRSRESFLPINYEFKKGNVYGVVSDFGCGSWGLSTCLGGRFSDKYRGEIRVNDDTIPPIRLIECSGFISEKSFDKVSATDTLLTPRKCVEKALELSGQPYSVEEIKKIFCLSDGRFDYPIDYVSGEIWLISIAINFALGKDVFCYPWLNEVDIERYKIAVEHKIIDFLKRKEKIIIVPSSQKKILQKYCDYTIIIKKEKIVYR